MNSLSNLR